MLSSFFKKKNYLFIFVCAGSSLLDGLFSSWEGRGSSLVVVHGLPIAMAFLVVEHRL